MGKPVIEKLRTNEIGPDDEIKVTYTVGINRNLIIAMLGKRLPYPKKPGKRLVDYLEKRASKILETGGII